MASFLDLPPELAIRILLCLALEDLASCHLTNSYVHLFIADSVDIQYHIATLIAGVENNENLQLETVARTERLKSLERGWNQAKFDFSREIDIPTNTEIKRLADGVYFYGGNGLNSSAALHYFTLPSRPEEEIYRKQIKIENAILAIGVAVYEHDLVAVATRWVQFPPPHLLQTLLLIEAL